MSSTLNGKRKRPETEIVSDTESAGSNFQGACQCPKPGDLPEVDGEGEPSASVSWATGVRLGFQVTADPVLWQQFVDAVRELRPSMTRKEYDKAMQAWNKEWLSGNLLNVHDFIAEKNIRDKRWMTKLVIKRHFIR